MSSTKDHLYPGRFRNSCGLRHSPSRNPASCRGLRTLLIPDSSGLRTIIPVRPERSGAKSKDAIFVLAAVLMVAALAGCGGGGSGGKTAAALPMPTPIALPQGIVLEPGAILTIPAGTSRPVGQADGLRAVASCPQGGEDCVLTGGPDGAAQYTGGMPTLETVPYTAIQLPEGDLMLPEDPITILAGTSYILRQTFDARTELKCPDDGPDCVVSSTEDGGAESTGGTPTVVTYTALFLPIDLSSDSNPEGTVPAGGERQMGDAVNGEFAKSYVLACPSEGADSEDCVVTLGKDDYESTGGVPYFAARYNDMIRSANDGPDGTSDGTYALQFEDRGGRGAAATGLNVAFDDSSNGWAVRNGAIVHNTRSVPAEGLRRVDPTATWDDGAAPTFGLTVERTGTESFEVDEDSNVPHLGDEGWNGAILSKATPGGTAYAVIHSNIEQASAGTPDSYYQTLGLWLVVPNDPAASVTAYNVGTFSQSVSPNNLTGANVVSLGGTATFTGPATGIYTEGTWSGTGGSRRPQTAKVGSFRATATINANFGVSGGFSGLSLGGSVTNFTEEGESLGWTMNLNSTSSRSSGNLDLWVGGQARGNGGTGRSFTAGHWGVQFYRAGTSGHPDTAVGIFHASTDDSNNDGLRIYGAYSADRQ